MSKLMRWKQEKWAFVMILNPDILVDVTLQQLFRNGLRYSMRVMTWPANSPLLNLSECLWDVLEEHI